MRTLINICIFFLALNLGYSQPIAPSFKTNPDFRQPLELFQKGQYALAQYELDCYVRLYPHDLQAIEAQYHAALCAVKLKQIDADARLKAFMDAYPGHPKAAFAYYELGNIQLAKQDYKQGIDYYLLVDVGQLDKPTQHSLYYQLAYAYLNEKNFEQALNYFNQVKAQDSPYSCAANYYAGYLAFKIGDYETALIDLKKAGENEAYQTIVPYLILEVLYQQERFQELVDHSERLQTLSAPIQNADDVELLTAEAYFFLQVYPAAVKHYEAYIGLSGQVPNQAVIYRLAYALYKSGEDYKALKYFKEVALQDSLLGQMASYYLGIVYVKTNQKKLAITAFDQARQKSYDRSIKTEAAFQYAKVNYDLGNWTAAINALEQFQKYYSTSKHYKEANSLLSEAYLYTNNYDLAIHYIEKLPSQSATTRKVYQQVTLYKGQQCFNAAAYDQAEYWLKKSLENPHDSALVTQAHFWLGEILAAKQAYKQSIDHYQLVLTKHSPSTELGLQALYGLAYAYFNTQAYNQALTKFKQYTKQASQEKPSSWMADAQLRIADCYYATKDYQQALQMYNQVLAQYPAHAHHQKALIYATQGNVQAAEENWRIIHQKYTDTSYYEPALLEYAHLSLQVQDYALAIERFTKFIQQRPQSPLKPDALLGRAIAYGNLNHHAEAAQDYQVILQNYPQHPHAASAILALPQLLIKLGREKEIPQYLAKHNADNPHAHSGEYASFEAAKTLFYNQSYEQAIAQLNSFIDHYAKSGLIYEAHFLLGESYYRVSKYAAALQNYQTAAQVPGTDFHRKALLRIASIAYEQLDFQTALAYYEQLKVSASNKKETYYALEGIMKASYALQDYEKAKQAASLIKEQGNIVIHATDQAALYSGKAAMQQGDNQQAIGYFKQLIANGKDSYAAEAQYLLATIYYQSGQYNQSLETLFELNKQFAAYNHWVNQSFLLIADNYLALGELFQAKATLQSIIEHATDAALVRDAEQKLMEVNQQADSLTQTTDQKEAEELSTNQEQDHVFEIQEPSDTSKY